MLKLGETQTLQVSSLTEHGAYLTPFQEAQGDPTRVLLPGRYLPKHLSIGDPIEVFVYLDSEDRPVATTDKPKIQMGQVTRLQVKETGRIGAFLDWGLPKDLLLPFSNQTKRVKAGEEVLCALLIDKSGRLAATMNVYEALSQDSPYHKDDWVEGTAYEKSDNFGIFIAVEDRYSALLAKKEITREIAIGERVRARVLSVMPDGRLSLSLRDKAYLQMDQDAALILKRLEETGPLPFTDKASPELIRKEFGMSKNEFKRAVGRLLKEDKIIIEEGHILLTEKSRRP